MLNPSRAAAARNASTPRPPHELGGGRYVLGRARSPSAFRLGFPAPGAPSPASKRAMPLSPDDIYPRICQKMPPPPLMSDEAENGPALDSTDGEEVEEAAEAETSEGDSEEAEQTPTHAEQTSSRADESEPLPAAPASPEAAQMAQMAPVAPASLISPHADDGRGAPSSRRQSMRRARPRADPAAGFEVCLSSIGPREDSNRGLRVAPGSHIPEGEIREMHVDRKVSIERPYHETAASLAAWKLEVDAQLNRAEKDGYHNYPLNAEEIARSEQVVIKVGGELQLMSRRQLEQHVTLQFGSPTWALFKPETSSFAYMQDNAYYMDEMDKMNDADAERAYHKRVDQGANHAVVHPGISRRDGAFGVFDTFYVEFEREAPAGEEVSVTYGWYYWSEDRRLRGLSEGGSAVAVAPAPPAEAGNRARTAQRPRTDNGVDNAPVPVQPRWTCSSQPAGVNGEEITCGGCGLGGDEWDNQMLYCDGKGCSAVWHQQCLSPALSRMPEGEWFCSARCRSSPFCSTTPPRAERPAAQQQAQPPQPKPQEEDPTLPLAPAPAPTPVPLPEPPAVPGSSEECPIELE